MIRKWLPASVAMILLAGVSIYFATRFREPALPPQASLADDPFSGVAAPGASIGTLAAPIMDQRAINEALVLFKQARPMATGVVSFVATVQADGRGTNLRAVGGNMLAADQASLASALEGRRLFVPAPNRAAAITVVGPLIVS